MQAEIDMKVHRFINPYREANTYVLEVDDTKVVIIDFGDYNLKLFTKWLADNKKEITAVIITHEHSDHCSGLDALYDIHKFQLLCSKKSAENIRNSKQNFSYYIDRAAFELTLPASIVPDGAIVKLGDREFKVIETPGHSPGGICIFTEDMVFTGDTILNGKKTPLSFPHSSKKDYAVSIDKIMPMLRPGMMIYPGHELPFEYQSQESLTV